MIRLEYKRPIDENATLVQLFVRLMGLLWLLVFLDTAWQWRELCGQEGLLPASAFAEHARQLYAPWHFFRFPSLLWISGSDAWGLALLSLGGLGAVLALTDRLATLGLTACFSVWLSVVNFGGDFFAQQWDTLLLEAGFLAIFMSWLRNAGAGRKMAVAALLMLSVRFWLSTGLVQLLHGGVLQSLPSFMADALSGQPMPTPLAWHASQWPDWLLNGIAWAYLALLFVPPLLLVWPKTRRFGFAGLLAASLLCFLLWNEGWTYLLTLILSVPALMGTGWGRRLGRWLGSNERWNRYLRFDPQYQRLKDWPRRGGMAVLQLQMALQAAWLILLAFPVGNRTLNHLNYVAYQPKVVEWEGEAGLKTTLLVPMRAGSNFRMANPYGFRKRGATRRMAYVFEVSADTTAGYWHPLGYGWMQGAGNPPMWVGPTAPRFDWQMQLEALGLGYEDADVFHHLWGQRPCWLDALKSRIQAGQLAGRWFSGEPEIGDAPQAMRLWVKELRFASRAERSATGSEWIVLRDWRVPLTSGESLPCPMVLGSPK